MSNLKNNSTIFENYLQAQAEAVALPRAFHVFVEHLHRLHLLGFPQIRYLHHVIDLFISLAECVRQSVCR